MQDFSVNPWMPYMQSVGIYDDNNPMLIAPEQQLERMYPRIYYIINPVVIRHCDMMDDTYGPFYTPTNEELEYMTDNIVSNVEGMVKTETSGGSHNPHNPDGDPFLRGLVGTLLIRELLGRRRRRHFRRFPGFFPFFPFF